MNTENIPKDLQLIFPIVQKYGIGDDYQRENVIKNESEKDLINIIEVSIFKELEIEKYLFGKELDKYKSTKEYITFTNFSMAVDSAKERLLKEVNYIINECEIKWKYLEKEIDKIIKNEGIEKFLIPLWNPVDTELGLNWLKIQYMKDITLNTMLIN